MAKKQAARRRASVTTKAGLTAARAVKPEAPVTRKAKPQKRPNWRSIAIDRKAEALQFAADKLRLTQQLQSQGTYCRQLEEKIVEKDAEVARLTSVEQAQDAEIVRLDGVGNRLQQQASELISEKSTLHDKVRDAKRTVDQTRDEVQRMERDMRRAIGSVEITHERALATKQERIESLEKTQEQHLRVIKTLTARAESAESLAKWSKEPAGVRGSLNRYPGSVVREFRFNDSTLAAVRPNGQVMHVLGGADNYRFTLASDGEDYVVRLIHDSPKGEPKLVAEQSYKPAGGWGQVASIEGFEEEIRKIYPSLSPPVRLDEETRHWMRSTIREEYARWWEAVAQTCDKPVAGRTLEELLEEIQRGDANVESLKLFGGGRVPIVTFDSGTRTVGSVPASREEWEAQRQTLDLRRRRRAESAGSPATTSPESSVVTPQQVIAQLISTLQMLTLLTVTKIDDTALTFVIAIKDMPWFIALVGRVTPIPPSADPATVEVQSISYEPEMIQALNDFAARTQRQGIFGKYGQILSLILQIVALIKGQAAPPAAG